MARILVTDKVASDAIAKLKEEHDVEEFLEWTPEQLNDKIKGFDALVIRSRTQVTKELIDSADSLKVVARAGAGLDNVDRGYASEKGIKVLNTPTANLLSAAELTVGLAFALLRNIARADRGIRSGLWEKKDLTGLEISGKTWGIVGFGHVGRLVNGLIKGFGCRVVAYDPYVKQEDVDDLGVEMMSLDDVMSNSDIVSVHVPLMDATRGIVGADELAKMKQTAILINTSRGGTVDEEALFPVLRDKKILGAALDVFEEEPPKDSPLISLENTVFTCHIGAQTKDAQKRVGEQLVKVLLEAL